MVVELVFVLSGVMKQALFTDENYSTMPIGDGSQTSVYEQKLSDQEEDHQEEDRNSFSDGTTTYEKKSHFNNPDSYQVYDQRNQKY